MRHFTIILVVLNFINSGFSIYTLFTLCPFETKEGVFVIFGPELYF
jgi:hypothetical protein